MVLAFVWWRWDQVLSERACQPSLRRLGGARLDTQGRSLILTANHDVGRKRIHIIITDYFARFQHGTLEAKHIDIGIEGGYFVAVGKHVVQFVRGAKIHVQIGQVPARAGGAGVILEGRGAGREQWGGGGGQCGEVQITMTTGGERGERGKCGGAGGIASGRAGMVRAALRMVVKVMIAFATAITIANIANIDGATVAAGEAGSGRSRLT